MSGTFRFHPDPPQALGQSRVFSPEQDHEADE